MLKEGRPTEYRLQTLVNKCGTVERMGKRRGLRLFCLKERRGAMEDFGAAGGKEVKGMLVSCSKIRN